MTQKTPQNFDAATVPLSGSNLIEASAGTGKTYSIALLALRLLLEKEVSVDQVLMVTFTKAAVAELEERVRKFIRLAFRYASAEAKDEQIEDRQIARLVDEAKERNGADTTIERLQDAVLLLDELSITTIHGFCQQSLTEFAFETQQAFGAEMFTDLNSLVEQEVNVFWRKHVTTMDAQVLKLLGYEGLRQEIGDIVKAQLEGKHYEGYEDTVTYSMEDLSAEAFLEYQGEIQAEAVAYEQSVLNAFDVYKEEISAICHSSKARNKQQFIEAIPYPEAFIELLNTGKPNVLTKALPAAFLEVYHAANKFISEAGQLVQLGFKSKLYYIAIAAITKAVRDFLSANNLLGYNDLIKNLHRAFTEQPNPALVNAMQQKYKAVFIDEFQDTDREQYEIFSLAFPAPTILFLIGDPKQSIYAWRKADIFTYFMARNQVQHYYTMNTNYRSSASLIEGMNQFFKPEDRFDTFYFSGMQDSIDYIPIESPAKNSKGNLLYEGLAVSPISITNCSNKEAIQQSVALHIQQLLTDPGFQIEQEGSSRPVNPSDIGILVRTNKEALGIRHYLNQKGIPVVSVQDEKILASDTAADMLYLLEAVWAPSVATINRALLSKFTRFSTEDLMRLNEEVVLSSFQAYKNMWIEDGIYPALMRFVADFGIRQNLGRSHVGYERIVANLFQLIELLNQTQQLRELSPEELISWLKRGLNGMPTEGDEYQVRMESDDDAVKIITIHKSKGLEYNIVFAPFLDMNAEGRYSFAQYRHPVSGNYLTKETLRLTTEEREWNRMQQEQENRRLIYVAITRGVYKCYVYKSGWSGHNNSSLSAFTRPLSARNAKEVVFEEAPVLDLPLYRPASKQNRKAALEANSFRLLEENWRKLSYTGISVHTDIIPKERSTAFEQEYDEFVFSRLRFGAASGNLLHYLLEHIDFTSEQYWDDIIGKAMKAYLPAAGEPYTASIKKLLQHVVAAPISIGDHTFSLDQVPLYKRIAELEFDFPLHNLNTATLETAAQAGQPVLTRSFEGKRMEGIMNGKIDLFFEHGNRYYILDWKSNYLGYSLDNYDAAGVKQGMDENNYHLQYLIYSVAVKKYLESRLPDFEYDQHFGGVIYLFLRGVRKDKNTGIFTARPALEQVEHLENLLGK